MAFCPEHDTLKWDQTPEFTPYARRRASPPLSYAESPPALYTGWPLDTGSKKYNSKNSISSRRLVPIRSDVWPQLATFISERMTKKTRKSIVVPRYMLHYLKLTPCDCWEFANGDRLIDVETRGGGVLPYITYTYMCRPTGSWFWSSWLRTGYPFQRRFLERGIKNCGSRLYPLLKIVADYEEAFIWCISRTNKEIPF